VHSTVNSFDCFCFRILSFNITTFGSLALLNWTPVFESHRVCGLGWSLVENVTAYRTVILIAEILNPERYQTFERVLG
jgi:hypothetical protein